VTASLLRNVISTALVTAAAFGIGFRPHSSVAAFAAALREQRLRPDLDDAVVAARVRA
jgi:hypothetical protein